MDKYIKMGPQSPDIALPEPVSWKDDDKSPLPDDNSSYHSSLSSSSFSATSMSLTHAEPTVAPADDDKSVVVMMKEDTAQRCNCVEEMQRILAQVMKQSKKDDETVCSAQSDLDSNAFYWEPSPHMMKHDYSSILDKAVQRRSVRLYEQLQTLHVEDPAVVIAVKELMTSDEKVSQILKRMHEGLRRHSPTANATPPSNTSLLTSFETLVKPTFHSTEIADLLHLGPSQGYLWKKDGLHAYDISPAFEHLRADMEHAKLSALKQLLRDSVLKYDQDYTALREAFRAVVNSGKYRVPMEDGATPQLPAQWLSQHLGDSPERFNVNAFVKESKIGLLEKEPQYFALDDQGRAFVVLLKAFVGPKESAIHELGRHATFDLKRTDDVRHRFLKHTQDVTLVLSTLSVFLSHHCVLLRVYINHAYPNLAIWLHLIEYFEAEEQRRVLSPFFPPSSRKVVDKQLTDLGFMDDAFQTFTTVFAPAPLPSSAPPAVVIPEQETEVEEQDLRFSTIFLNLFARKS